MNEGLGRQPRPTTGLRRADYSDPATSRREALVSGLVRSIWIDHRPQQDAIGRILAYRLRTREGLGHDIDGLCLSQDSQVGKSATCRRVKHLLAQDAMAEGREPNPHQVLVVGLDQRTSLKSVLQDILIQLGDPDWDYGTEKQLRQRIAHSVTEMGVELIVIDECQHLTRGGNDVADVTDALKRILDLGIAPLVLIGNLDAEAVFNRNPQFRARLGMPLSLPALDPGRTRDMVLFRKFVRAYDEALTTCKAVEVSPNLTAPARLNGLLAVSTGHFGRVARVLKNAAVHAAARRARTIDVYDLSCVARGYAMQNRWVDHDPFSIS